jgi:sulfur-oxidizing protein SoxX
VIRAGFITAFGIVLAGCSALGGSAAISDQALLDELNGSFRASGQATLDRVRQSEMQQACSEAAAHGGELPAERREAIQRAAQATIRKPSDGVWLGDWREGERIAQNGRGLQFSDAPGSVNGGNCYACHQLSRQEISFGNLGPSLLNYGKLRGVRLEAGRFDAASLAVVEYTWGKLWNSHATQACSNMPRFGDAGILSEQQLKHLMALLLDPQSPVNQ